MSKSKSVKKSKSINLYPVGGDNSDSDKEEDENDTERIIEESKAKSEKEGVWNVGGVRKNNLIAQVINLSSKFVSSELEQVTLPNGETTLNKIYTALPDAAQVAYDLKKLLDEHDHPDHRNLSILLNKYQLLPSQLLPLLSISMNEGLTSRYCLRVISQLLLPISEATLKTLKSYVKSDKKAKETKSESIERITGEKHSIENANEQIRSLLAFKEALVNDDVLFNNICVTLSGPLRKVDTERTDGENQIIETVLHILSNLSSIQTIGNSATTAEKLKSKELQCKLIQMFDGAILNIIINFCESISTPIFKDNLNFFIDLISSMLRGVDSKDIFKHWKTNGLGVNHANNATAKVTAHNSNSTKNETSGGLLSQLKNERMGRLATIQQGNLRHSRFGGLFAVSSNSVQNRNAVDSLPLDGFSTPAQGHNVATSSSNNVTDKHEHGGMNRQTLVQNPFRSVADNLHQANQRKTKANVPFAADNIEDESLVSAHAIPSHLISNCLSVLVTFLERFTKRGFEKLVHIVKEDRRRDENRVGEGAEELEFFHIIRMCLKYHRSKVLHRRDHNIKVYHQMIDTKPDLVDPSTSWVPNIRCMMAALDRMSFIRVIDAINRALRNKKYENVIVPMETFKEMLCYINLMLQSTNNAHHELAIAALHPLFYTIRADRLDPLPALLREWKPSIYKRKHGHVLIELVHETLKTLDAAKNCFKGRENESDLKKSGRSVETDIDRYVIACLRFDESEYFARIVTNHTVRFYTVMLNDYRVTNNQTIHHYMYCFLQRMYAHKIENDRYGITSDEFSNDKNGGNGNVTLAYLLFNIHTLNAINNILVYNNSKYDKENTPLIRLLRCIVRLFAECAQKNHMLFVEALFAHAHPMDFALSLDTVYDAKMFATTQSKSMVDRNGSGAGYSEDEDSTGGDYSDKGINSTTKTNIESASANTNSAIAPSSTEEASYDFGDEFDENELPSSFNRLKKHNDKKGSKSTRRRLGTKTKELVKANHSASRDEDSDSDSATQTQTPANSSPRSSSKKASTTNTNSPGKRKWTQEHDEVLREQYSLYQSSRSCYDMIASHELFSDHYNAKQIRKRVKTLMLDHQKQGNSPTTSLSQLSEAQNAMEVENADMTEGQTQHQGSDSDGTDDEDQFKTGKHNLITPYSTDDEQDPDDFNSKPAWEDDEDDIEESAKWNNQIITSTKKRIQKHSNANTIAEENGNSDEETSDLFESNKKVEEVAHVKNTKRTIVDDEE